MYVIGEDTINLFKRKLTHTSMYPYTLWDSQLVPFGQSRSKVQEFFKQSLIYTRLTQTNEVWGNQFVEGGEVDRWIDGKMVHIPSVQTCPQKLAYVKNLMRGAYIHL